MPAMVTVKLTAKEFDNIRQAVRDGLEYVKEVAETLRLEGKKGQEVLNHDFRADDYARLLKGPLS